MAAGKPVIWRRIVPHFGGALSGLSPPPLPLPLCKVLIDRHSILAYTVDISQDSPAARGRGWLAYGREQQGISVYPHGREVASGAGGEGLHLSAQGERTPAAQGGGGVHPHALPHAGGLSGLHFPAGGAAAGALRRGGGLEPGACAIPAASGGIFRREAFRAFADSPGVAAAFVCCCAERRGRRSLPGWLRIRRWLGAGFRRLLPDRRDAGPYSWRCGCGWLGRACIPVSDSAKLQPRDPMNRSNKPSALPLAHPASPKTTTRRGICPGQDHRTPIVQKEGAEPCIHPLLPSSPATRWGCF